MEIRPIKGSQYGNNFHLSPNSLDPECIRVQKVYDWVIDAVTDDREITVPVECQEAIDKAICDGRKLDVECIAPEVPPTFPIIPKPQPDPEDNFSCTVSSRIDRRPFDINGEIVELGIVKLLFRVRPLVRVFDNDGDLICQFRPTIAVSKKVAVCFPDEFTTDNILCRITQITCDENFNETGDPDLGLQLDVTICFEIQVEAEVKLEVLAKFCHPRPNDIDITPTVDCPTFEFPEQCPTVFPRENCDCQAWVMASNEDVSRRTTQSGEGVSFNDTIYGTFTFPSENLATLNAEICDNCTLAGSFINFRFRDLSNTSENPDMPNVGFRFTATSDTMDQPFCTDNVANLPENPRVRLLAAGITSAELIMYVEGTGRITYQDPEFVDREVSFYITLVETAGDMEDYYLLAIYDPSNLTQHLNTVFLPVDNNELKVQDCVTFGDLQINRP